MRVLAAGGGSGGHVTPVVAVLRELSQRHPEAEIRFWCDSKFAPQARSLIASYDPSVRVDTIASGKLRRYHALAWWRQALRWRTIVLPNIIDSFKVAAGVVQSLVKLIAWRPDVVFTKGGFVCLPIGLAARLLRIPLVIHDSDAHPGLTNRILARWADCILTGAPLKYYNYPDKITRYVGIPIQLRSVDDQATDSERKQRLGFAGDRPLIVCTGGGLGAARINQAIALIMPELVDHGYSVVLVTGQSNYQSTIDLIGATPEGSLVTPFIAGNLDEYFAAADVVVTRAGATTLLELAALGRPTIIIPNIHLTGGHQHKNAAVYAESDAAVVVEEVTLESEPSRLTKTIVELIEQPNRRQALSQAILTLAKPEAAIDTVDAIEDVLRLHGVKV